jgi:hypothetical protein
VISLEYDSATSCIVRVECRSCAAWSIVLVDKTSELDRRRCSRCRVNSVGVTHYVSDRGTMRPRLESVK